VEAGGGNWRRGEESTAHLGLDDLLHVGGDIIQLQLELALLLLQLLLHSLQVVDLLTQLGHTVSVLLAQGSRRGLVLQRGLLQVPPHLLALILTSIIFATKLLKISLEDRSFCLSRASFNHFLCNKKNVQCSGPKAG